MVEVASFFLVFSGHPDREVRMSYKELKKTKAQLAAVEKDPMLEPLANPKRLRNRKEYNRRDRADHVRDKISDTQQLNQVLRVLKQVDDLDVKFSRIPRNRWTQEVKRKLDGLLAAKKLKMDGHLKLLNKVIGDQRSVGIEGEDGELPQLTLRVVRGVDESDDS
jgi:hypothetical protein